MPLLKPSNFKYKLFLKNICLCQMCSSILQLVLHHQIHQNLIHLQGLHLVLNHEVC
jgi:hypothetical protein